MADLAVTAGTAITDVSGANDDEHLVQLWLQGTSSVNTRTAYAADAERFRANVAKPLRAVTVADLSAWVASLVGAESSKARRVSAAKSLLSFGHRTGYLPFNVGSVIRPPKVRNELSERILREVDVLRMIDRAEGRDRIFLRTLYASACRVSEIVALDWRHVRKLTDGCSILTIHGKGGKTRHVRLDTGSAAELEQLRTIAGAPVFTSRFGTRLAVRDAHRLVAKAAKRARIKANVSPHWLRHCAASHGLDRGAPISLVQATLGHASVQTTGRYLHVKPGDGLANYLPV